MTGPDTSPPRAGRQWLQNVLSGYAGIAVEGLAFLFLTPIIVGHLGVEGYALWVLGHTIVFYLKFLDFGFGGAQIRFHARFAARENGRDVRQLTRTVMTALVLGGLAAAIIGLLIASMSTDLWLRNAEVRNGDFHVVLALLAVELLLAFPASVLDNVYEGIQRFDLRNLRNIALIILKTGVQLAVIYAGQGIVALAMVEVMATAVYLSVDVVMISRLCPGLLNADVGIDRRIWKRVRGFAFWNFLDDILVEGTPQLTKLLVALLLPLALLSPYSLALTIAGVLVAIVHPITDTLLPMASSLHAQGRRSDLGDLLVSGSKGLLALTAPAALTVGFLGSAALGLWVTEIEGTLPTSLIPLVVTDVLFSVYFSTSAVILMATNGLRNFVVLTVVELALGVLLSLVLAPTFGLTGLAAASLVANVVVGFGLQLPLVARRLRIPVAKLLLHAPLGVLCGCIPAGLAGLALIHYLPSPGWLGLMLQAGLLGLAALLGVAVVSVSLDERRRFKALWLDLRKGADA